jgi:hypothetical protein
MLFSFDRAWDIFEEVAGYLWRGINLSASGDGDHAQQRNEAHRNDARKGKDGGRHAHPRRSERRPGLITTVERWMRADLNAFALPLSACPAP